MTIEIYDFAQEIDRLSREREAIIFLLPLKIAGEDWHGVSDFANDLREIDAELELLRKLSGK